MDFLKNKSNYSLSQIAISYVLHRNEISTCISSVSNTQQLQENVESSKIVLSNNDLKKIQLIKKN